MAEYGREMALPWEGPALTRQELVRGYALVERAREREQARRERTGARSWTESRQCPDGRVEVRVFEQGRLVRIDRHVVGPAAPAPRPGYAMAGRRLA
jgi:hypothetical protein